MVSDGSRIGLKSSVVEALVIGGSIREDPFYKCELTSLEEKTLAYQYVKDLSDASNLLQQAVSLSDLEEKSFPANHTKSYAQPESGNQKPWVFNALIAREPGVMPYNSSITINGSTYALPPPLLRFAPPWYPSEYDTLQSEYSTYIQPCYNLELSPSIDSAVYCIADEGYIWGFSQYLLIVGLIAEIIWIWSLYIVWLNANVRSTLIKRGIGFSNIHRNMANFVQLMQEDLVDDLNCLSDQQFKESLEGIGDVGLEMKTWKSGESSGWTLTGRRDPKHRNVSQRDVPSKGSDFDPKMSLIPIKPIPHQS